MIIRAYVTVTPLSYSTTLSGGKLAAVLSIWILVIHRPPLLETIRCRRSSIIRNRSSDCNTPSATGIRIIYGTEGVETFRFENGETMERTSEGLPRGMSETAHNLSLNYNLVDNDHYYFNATLRYFLSDEDKGGGKNLYTNNNPEDKTYAWNPNSNSTKRPSLDLYYQQLLTT